MADISLGLKEKVHSDLDGFLGEEEVVADATGGHQHRQPVVVEGVVDADAVSGPLRPHRVIKGVLEDTAEPGEVVAPRRCVGWPIRRRQFPHKAEDIATVLDKRFSLECLSSDSLCTPTGKKYTDPDSNRGPSPC